MYSAAGEGLNHSIICCDCAASSFFHVFCRSSFVGVLGLLYISYRFIGSAPSELFFLPFIPSVTLSLFFSLSSSFSLSPLLPSRFISLSLPPSLLPSFLPFSLPSLFVRNNTPVAQTVKNLPPMWETQVRSLGLEDPLEKGMATHSSILARKTPWIEEPGGLLSMESQRIHNWVTNTTKGIISRKIWETSVS